MEYEVASGGSQGILGLGQHNVMPHAFASGY